MQYGLSSENVQKLKAVFNRYPEVTEVILYGSRAKGNFKNGSDIDFTVAGEEMNLQILHKVEDDLEELLLPYKIDLSLLSHIDNANLLEHIKRVGIVFWSDASKF
jgi:predicted nucleotidyltransferase